MTADPPGLAQAFADALGVPAFEKPQAAFLAQIEDDYDPNEAPALDVAALAASLADLWSFASGYAGGDPAIRAARAGAFDRLDIVQPDQTFLVDSVMGEVAEARLPVRAMFHAVVPLAEGKPASIITVFIDPLSPGQAQSLIARLRATLADARLAVGDYQAMRGLTESLER